MIGIGVVGYGYWGPNLVRNFFATKGAKVTVVCDLFQNRLNIVENSYPGIKVCNNVEDLLNDRSVDAVCIATPVSSHFEIAQKALNAGKHVLVEKPMTSTVEQAEVLLELASKRNLTLMVDHTFLFMGAVQKIKSVIESGELGDVYYYDSTRINLGLFQNDVNVIWDLAVHDLSLIEFLFPYKPVAVSATGISHLGGNIENIAYLTYFFQENAIAHINVNWLSPVKLRQTLIGGSKKMILFDDLHQSEKIRIYDRGISLVSDPERRYKFMVDYRTGDMCAPCYDRKEALLVEAEHFVNCINENLQPVTDGLMGLRIVKALAAANQSLKNQGQLVKFG
ncbi:MAG: Gfo/Idh/MocA family oxidoreductase [Pseudomonadota bacterium]